MYEPEPEPSDHDADPSCLRDDLLREQDGVIHRRDLSRDDLKVARRQIAAKRWQRVGRDVFVTHNGPLGIDQRLWAFLLASPHRSALSGLTAAALDGLKGFESTKIHITVPCGMSGVHHDDVEIHYSRFLDDQHVHPARMPRRTRLPRSLLDAAAWVPTDSYARAVLLAGVQQRLVTPAQLTDTLPTRGHCLRHALIEEAIDDAAGGIASVPERDFSRIITQFRLPEPTRQAIVQRPNGRYYLDADWREYDLTAEIDGMPHMSVRQWDADLDRANEIAIDGRTILRFTSYATRHEQTRIGTVLVRALTARGWPGPG